MKNVIMRPTSFEIWLQKRNFRVERGTNFLKLPIYAHLYFLSEPLQLLLDLTEHLLVFRKFFFFCRDLRFRRLSEELLVLQHAVGAADLAVQALLFLGEALQLLGQRRG